VDIVHKSCADGAEAETKRDGRDEPARADPFAGHVGRDFEDDVGDVEDRENPVVVIAFEVKILFETGELRVTCQCNVRRLEVSPFTGGITYRYWPDQ